MVTDLRLRAKRLRMSNFPLSVWAADSAGHGSISQNALILPANRHGLRRRSHVTTKIMSNLMVSPAALPHLKRYPTEVVASNNVLPKMRRQPRGLRHKQDGKARIIDHTELDFAHFKQRRRGNLQVGGTEPPVVPTCRGQRPTVRNLPTPRTARPRTSGPRSRPRRHSAPHRVRPSLRARTGPAAT